MKNDDISPSEFVDNPRLPGAALVRRGLVAATLCSTAMLALWLIVGLFTPGGLAAIDHRMMASLHGIVDPNDPIGPAWLEGAMRDITGLGSNTILVVLTLAAATLLARLHRLGPAVLLTTAMIAAFLFNTILKHVFDRERPDFLAASVTVDTSSFPSSHAMLSAVFYLLLAAIAAREISDRKLSIALLSAAGMLTLLIGVTRVYLGAHWPSDVLAGWLLGTAIALAGWQLARSPTPPESEQATGHAPKDNLRA